MLNSQMPITSNIQAAFRKQAGLSMVELMISLTMSAILLTGVAQIMVGVRQGERTQQAISQIQETASFALSFLAQDIRMAGYVGCLSGMEKANINNTLNGPPPSFEPDKGLQGWEFDGTDPGDVFNSINNLAVVDTGAGGWVTAGGNVLEDTDALPGSDILRIYAIDSQGGEGIINSVSPGASTVVNTNLFDVDNGDILLLSDCEKADWVQACNVNQVGNPATLNLILSAGCTPGNIASLSLGISSGASVARMSTTMYYIGKRNNDAENPPALFRKSLSADGDLGPGEEIIEGIESMQILYGENTNNDNLSTADAYVPADQVSNWDEVVSVRISMLIQSLEDNIVPNSLAYTFNSTTYDGVGANGNLPNDNRIRRVFTTTIGLRNRTLGGI